MAWNAWRWFFFFFSGQGPLGNHLFPSPGAGGPAKMSPSPENFPKQKSPLCPFISKGSPDDIPEMPGKAFQFDKVPFGRMGHLQVQANRIFITGKTEPGKDSPGYFFFRFF